MVELVSCQDNDKECPLCGRSQFQTTFCKDVVQAVGSNNYMIDVREQETHEISS